MTQAVLVITASTSALLSQVTPAWLARAAAAWNTQLVRDVQPTYGGDFGIRIGASAADIKPGEMVFQVVDALPDAPGDVAYHSVVGNDVPFAFLALSTCQTLNDVSTAISHEMCETAGDLSCNLWADDEQGNEWARELCDAVEGNSYGVDIGDGGPLIMVSDFLFPSFWGTGGQAPYTYCQAHNVAGCAFPTGPFQTGSNGYQVKRQATGEESQVQGMIREARKAKVAHWSSRPYRRGVRLAA